MITSPIAIPGTASARGFTIWGDMQSFGNIRYLEYGGDIDYVAQPMAVTRIQLLGHVALGWQIVSPLPVTVQEDEDGHFLLTDEVFYVYGCADDIAEAQEELIASLIEYHELISEFDDEPSRRLQRLLNQYLRPTLNPNG